MITLPEPEPSTRRVEAVLGYTGTMAASVPQIFADAIVGLPTIAELDVACSNEVCKQSFREYLPRVRMRLSQAGCTWNQPVQVHDEEYIEKNKVTHMLHCSCGGTYRALIAHSRTETVRESNLREVNHLSNVAHVNMMWVLASLSIRRLLPTTGAIMLRAAPHVGTENMNLVDGRLGVFPSEVNVSCSGFKSCTRYLVEIICHALGVKFQHNMHLAPSEAGPKTDLLVVYDNSETAVRGSEKLTRAWQSNIPVVNFFWLVESYIKWDLQPVDDPKYANASGDTHVTAGIERIFAGREDEETQRLGGFGAGPDIDTVGNVTEDELDSQMHQMGGLLAIEEDEQIKAQWSGSANGTSDGVSMDDAGNHTTLVNAPSTSEVLAEGGVEADTADAAEAVGKTRAPASSQKKRKAAAKAQGKRIKDKNQRTEHAPQMADPRMPRAENRGHDSGKAARPEKVTKSSGAGRSADQKGSKRLEEPMIHLTLSGMHSGEQKEVVPLMRSLGVPYSVGTHSWNDRFTHIITPSMRRNQKVLSALASGRWIVSPDFLRASVNKSKLALIGPSKLVPEKKYELTEGNPHHDIDKNIPRFWRERIQSSGTRPFEGLVISIHPSVTSRHAPSKEDIKAIVHAGGATVIPWSGIASSLADVDKRPGVDLVVALDTHVDQARADLELKIASSGRCEPPATKSKSGRPRRTSVEQKTSIFSSVEIVQWLVSLETRLEAKDGSDTLKTRLRMRN